MKTNVLLKSFIPFGAISLISASAFYMQKDYRPTGLLLHLSVHLLFLLSVHVGLVKLFLFASASFNGHLLKKILSGIYALVTYSVIFISIGSVITYYFWLAPVNSILIRNFLFHFEHYATVSFAEYGILVGLGVALLSLFIIAVLYRTCYKVLKNPNYAPAPINGRKYLLGGLALIAILSPILLLNKDVAIDELRQIKAKYVVSDPVLYTFYLAIRRAQIKRLVLKKEQELDTQIAVSGVVGSTFIPIISGVPGEQGHIHRTPDGQYNLEVFQNDQEVLTKFILVPDLDS